MILTVITSISISILPIYLKTSKTNFMEVAPNTFTALLLIGIIVLSIITLMTQKLWGGRWFIPKKYRYVDPNIY